jgi:hypothetical protein
MPRREGLTQSKDRIAKHRDGLYSFPAKWVKIKNPNYTQIEGRHELFESLRPKAVPSHRAARLGDSERPFPTSETTGFTVSTEKRGQATIRKTAPWYAAKNRLSLLFPVNRPPRQGIFGVQTPKGNLWKGTGP